MLATIHIIADSILIRKSLKWRNCTSADKMPLECKSLYNRLDQFLNDSLSDIIHKKRKIKNTYHYLFNLISVKESMDIHPCSIPCNLNKQELQIFLQDMDFYLMLSGILIKARNLYKGFIEEANFPSCIRILPVFNSNPKKIKQVYNMLKPSQWKLLVENYYLQNRYLKTLFHTEKLCESMSVEPFLLRPLNALNEAFRTLPTNADNEHILIHNLNDINKLLIRIKDNHSEQDVWIEYRQVITEPLVLGIGYKDLCELYIQQLQLQNNLTANTINSEIVFIKNQLSRAHHLIEDNIVKSNNGINLLNHLQLKVNKLTILNPTSQFLEWNHNPKDFVKKLHRVISSGYITLKGNSDIQPILEVISRFVRVKKQNHTGNLSYATLLTYFKKANTGEL